MNEKFFRNIVLLTILFITFNTLSSQVYYGKLLVRPKEIHSVLMNPGIGFSTFQRFNGDSLTTLKDNTDWVEGQPIEPQKSKLNVNINYPETTIAYWRVYWHYFEPKRGQYRWDLLDEALANARQHGQTLLFRVMPYNSIDEKGAIQDDVPAWYRNLVGPRTNWAYNNPVNAWLVDPEDPRYLQYFGGMIKKMAERYDGHPDLEGIDLSIVGAWGEGAGSDLLSQKTRQALVDVYADNFQKTPLIALLTDSATNAYINAKGKIGWRADCLGDLGMFTKDPHEFAHMYDRYPQDILKFGLGETWKKAPVYFEICHTFFYWKNKAKYSDEQVKYIIDQSLKWHISSFNAKSSPLPKEWDPYINEWLKKMGYRFVLRKLTCNAVVKRGSDLQFETWWENKGVAPVYKNYLLCFRFKNEKDSTIFVTNADITTWLPGDNLFDSSLHIPANIADGYYDVQVAICDPVSKKPVVQLAIEGKQKDGWYNLGSIKIE